MIRKPVLAHITFVATLTFTACNGIPPQEIISTPSVARTEIFTATRTPTVPPTPTNLPLCSDVIVPVDPTPSAVQGDTDDELSYPPVIMAHFMPWYEAPPFDGNWGWHWTMNHFATTLQGDDGKRPIASHYYPLSGPYASGDPDILEYQVLLLRLSGIDGVIVDWYGSSTFADYQFNHRNTQTLFESLSNTGLQFAVCYEDQTIGNRISGSALSKEIAISLGQKDMQEIQSLWLEGDTYLMIDDRPVILNFGPQYYKTSSAWEEVFSVFDVPPLFFTLDSKVGRASQGAFNWPPMYLSRNGVLSVSGLERQLSDFYYRSRYWDHHVASAFPGFNDIYQQAGVGPGYGFLEAANGTTFQLTLERAIQSKPEIIQLVTWNDYGEGTNIEPTEEYGYEYLEMVQEFRREWIDPEFPFISDHLRLPLRILELRRHFPDQSEADLLLDDASSLIISGQVDDATRLIDCLSSFEN